MCKIKDIEIKNFRGIHSLRIEDLRRVNVILGNNNCGKSSFLEAVLIMMGTNKPSLPMEMNINRNYTGFTKDDFATFFHNLDTKSCISFKVSCEGLPPRNVSIRYYQEQINEIKASDIHKDGNAISPQWEYGLMYSYGDNGEEKQISLSYDTSKKKIRIEAPEKASIMAPTFFMGARYNFNDYISHFNQIVTDKEKTSIIEALQAIEPKIRDIAVVGNNVKVDVQLSKMIPINLMGDGTRKLFTVATALYNAKKGVLIIDEVDNGLYYKSMKSLWKMIIITAVKLDVQVFVSTHSIDSLHALNNLLTDEMPNYCSDVKIYTLRKNEEDDVTCYPYEYEKFSYLLGMEEEIR